MRPSEIELGDERVARAVHEVGRRSYAVEAAIIGFDGIPALSESLTEMRAEPLRWIATSDADGLPVAFIAWARTDAGEVDIDRLCVDPGWFRKGLARELLDHLLTTQTDGDVLVSTGAANVPAVTLYTRAGFTPTGTSSPVPGLEMAHFRLTRGTAAEERG
ncbi:GNAT family N-acetyltransferase [Phytomonospora sp. NPDC050363]|uniref:GNAT family N-acetyltransferase n=1 Tax=Phytomonospora sp. NPDC050363 TaxID=3155642 RepID=UPI0033D249C2